MIMRAVKVISFGLLLSLSILNEVVCDCNYEQKLELGQTYYAYNPNYPNYDYNKTSCIWQGVNGYVYMICTIDIPTEVDFTIQFDEGVADHFLSNRNYSLHGTNPIITFNSFSNQYRSKFLCKIDVVKELNKNDEQDCQCGWTKTTRIIGGEETGVNEYPMMAGLCFSSTNFIFCGATIISPIHIVTAAHCIENRDINSFNIVIGEHDTETGNETDVTKTYSVKWCKIHPKYDDIHNDIAVCEIVGTIVYSSKVGPVCLPFQYKYYQFTDNSVTALGWGFTDFSGPKATALQKVQLEVDSLLDCIRKYEHLKNITDSNICTYTEGKDACQFDSGGPLLWKNKNGDTVLIGITCAGQGCASDKPGIWTRVTYYLEWIVSVTPGVQYCKKA